MTKHRSARHSNGPLGLIRPWTCSVLLIVLIADARPSIAQTPPPTPPPPAQTPPPAAPPSPPAAAQTPPPEPQYPQVAVGTLTYLQYSAEFQNRDGFNAFDVTRGYINITGDLAKNIKFRLTPDLRRISDGSLAGSLTFRLKYGFVEFDNLTPRSWLRFGLHQTPWLDFEESINRYRVQGQMFAERDGLIPGSGDFGVGYLTQFPGNYGEIQAGIYNGEGFTQAESNKYKSFQARFTVRPRPGDTAASGLRLTAFYNLGSSGRDLPRNLGIVMGSFEHKHVVATAEWLRATERPTLAVPEATRTGYSAFLEVRQGLEGWAGLARIDHLDPDDAVSQNSHSRVIAGVAYWLKWQKVRLGLVFTDEDVQYEVNRRRPDENRLFVQTHIQF